MKRAKKKVATKAKSAAKKVVKAKSVKKTAKKASPVAKPAVNKGNGRANADGTVSWNFKLLSHHMLDGFGGMGEGMSVQIAPDGQPALKEVKQIPIDLDHIEKNGKDLKARFNEIFQ